MFRFSILILLFFYSSAIQAEVYRCNITSYGKPNNFEGSKSEQKEFMTYSLPPETFFIEEKNDEALLHTYSDVEVVISKKIEETSARKIFYFNDFPKYIGRSFIRELEIKLLKDNLTFNIEMELRLQGYYSASGSAKGICFIN